MCDVCNRDRERAEDIAARCDRDEVARQKIADYRLRYPPVASRDSFGEATKIALEWLGYEVAVAPDGVLEPAGDVPVKVFEAIHALNLMLTREV
jgi:hypothetical protein